MKIYGKLIFITTILVLFTILSVSAGRRQRYNPYGCTLDDDCNERNVCSSEGYCVHTCYEKNCKVDEVCFHDVDHPHKSFCALPEVERKAWRKQHTYLD